MTARTASVKFTGLRSSAEPVCTGAAHDELQAFHRHVLSDGGKAEKETGLGWRLCNSIHSHQRGSGDRGMSFCVCERERVTRFVAQGSGLAMMYLDFIKEFNNIFHGILVFKAVV